MANVYSPTFLDKNGNQVEIDPDQVQDAIANGTVVLRKGTAFPVLNEKGKPVTIQSDQAAEALASGDYKYESPEQQAARHEKDFYNASALKQVEAAVAGAGVAPRVRDARVGHHGLDLGIQRRRFLGHGYRIAVAFTHLFPVGSAQFRGR